METSAASTVTETKLWFAVLSRGFVALLFALLALAGATPAIADLARLFAVYALVDGALALYAARRAQKTHAIRHGRVLALESDGRGLLRVDPVDGAGDFGRACGERVVSQQTGALRGQIAPQDSESVAGVLVRATWKEPVVVDRREFTTREQIREAFTDPAGRFTICDVPMRRDATLRWEVRGQERAVPITIGTPGAVQAVPIPRRP